MRANIAHLLPQPRFEVLRHDITFPVYVEVDERIITLCGSRSSIVFQPLPEDDPARRCPDIRAARRLLDWQPQTPLDEGLQKTIADFDALLVAAQPLTISPPFGCNT